MPYGSKRQPDSVEETKRANGFGLKAASTEHNSLGPLVRRTPSTNTQLSAQYRGSVRTKDSYKAFQNKTKFTDNKIFNVGIGFLAKAKANIKDLPVYFFNENLADTLLRLKKRRDINRVGLRFTRKQNKHISLLGPEFQRAVDGYNTRYYRGFCLGAEKSEFENALHYEYLLSYCTHKPYYTTDTPAKSSDSDSSSDSSTEGSNKNHTLPVDPHSLKTYNTPAPFYLPESTRLFRTVHRIFPEKFDYDNIDTFYCSRIHNEQNWLGSKHYVVWFRKIRAKWDKSVNKLDLWAHFPESTNSPTYIVKYISKPKFKRFLITIDDCDDSGYGGSPESEPGSPPSESVNLSETDLENQSEQDRNVLQLSIDSPPSSPSPPPLTPPPDLPSFYQKASNEETNICTICNNCNICNIYNICDICNNCNICTFCNTEPYTPNKHFGNLIEDNLIELHSDSHLCDRFDHIKDVIEETDILEPNDTLFAFWFQLLTCDHVESVVPSIIPLEYRDSHCDSSTLAEEFNKEIDEIDEVDELFSFITLDEPPEDEQTADCCCLMNSCERCQPYLVNSPQATYSSDCYTECSSDSSPPSRSPSPPSSYEETSDSPKKNLDPFESFSWTQYPDEDEHYFKCEDSPEVKVEHKQNTPPPASVDADVELKVEQKPNITLFASADAEVELKEEQKPNIPVLAQVDAQVEPKVEQKPNITFLAPVDAQVIKVKVKHKENIPPPAPVDLNVQVKVKEKQANFPNWEPNPLVPLEVLPKIEQDSCASVCLPLTNGYSSIKIECDPDYQPEQFTSLHCQNGFIYPHFASDKSSIFPPIGYDTTFYPDSEGSDAPSLPSLTESDIKRNKVDTFSDNEQIDSKVCEQLGQKMNMAHSSHSVGKSDYEIRHSYAEPSEVRHSEVKDFKRRGGYSDDECSDQEEALNLSMKDSASEANHSNDNRKVDRELAVSEQGDWPNVVMEQIDEPINVEMKENDDDDKSELVDEPMIEEHDQVEKNELKSESSIVEAKCPDVPNKEEDEDTKLSFDSLLGDIFTTTIEPGVNALSVKDEDKDATTTLDKVDADGNKLEGTENNDKDDSKVSSNESKPPVENAPNETDDDYCRQHCNRKRRRVSRVIKKIKKPKKAKKKKKSKKTTRKVSSNDDDRQRSTNSKKKNKSEDKQGQSSKQIKQRRTSKEPKTKEELARETFLHRDEVLARAIASFEYKSNRPTRRGTATSNSVPEFNFSDLDIKLEVASPEPQPQQNSQAQGTSKPPEELLTPKTPPTPEEPEPPKTKEEFGAPKTPPTPEQPKPSKTSKTSKPSKTSKTSTIKEEPLTPKTPSTPEQPKPSKTPKMNAELRAPKTPPTPEEPKPSKISILSTIKEEPLTPKTPSTPEQATTSKPAKTPKINGELRTHKTPKAPQEPKPVKTSQIKDEPLTPKTLSTPDESRTSKTSKTSKTKEELCVPKTPPTPEIPKSSKTSKTSKTSTIKEEPLTPKTPPTPEVTKQSKTSKSSTIKDEPLTPKTPSTPEVPKPFKTSKTSKTSKSFTIKEEPLTPKTPSTPDEHKPSKALKQNAESRAPKTPPTPEEPKPSKTKEKRRASKTLKAPQEPKSLKSSKSSNTDHPMKITQRCSQNERSSREQRLMDFAASMSPNPRPLSMPDVKSESGHSKAESASQSSLQHEQKPLKTPPKPPITMGQRKIVKRPMEKSASPCRPAKIKRDRSSSSSPSPSPVRQNSKSQNSRTHQEVSNKPSTSQNNQKSSPPAKQSSQGKSRKTAACSHAQNCQPSTSRGSSVKSSKSKESKKSKKAKKSKKHKHKHRKHHHRDRDDKKRHRKHKKQKKQEKKDKQEAEAEAQAVKVRVSTSDDSEYKHQKLRHVAQVKSDSSSDDSDDEMRYQFHRGRASPHRSASSDDDDDDDVDDDVDNDDDDDDDEDDDDEARRAKRKRKPSLFVELESKYRRENFNFHEPYKMNDNYKKFFKNADGKICINEICERFYFYVSKKDLVYRREDGTPYIQFDHKLCSLFDHSFSQCEFRMTDVGRALITVHIEYQKNNYLAPLSDLGPGLINPEKENTTPPPSPED